jgi:HJR/Mrr/RecB family endonuclease
LRGSEFRVRGLEFGVRHPIVLGARARPRARKAGKTKKQLQAEFSDGLTEKILAELQEGCGANDDRLERVVAALFKKLGASGVHITAGKKDLGADVVGYFDIGQILPLKFGVQVKWNWGKTEAWAVQQIMEAWDKEQLQLGFVVSTAEFSAAAEAMAENVRTTTGRIVTLVNGAELANQILNSGIDVLV